MRPARSVVLSCLLLGQGGHTARRSLEDHIETLQATANQDPAVVSRVAIVGNIDTGKSTLCQWLLGSTAVCPVFDNIGENTNEAAIYAGHWFGNPANGALEVLDTPGFLGEDDPGLEWVHIVKNITDVMQKIDAVIMAVSTEGAASAFRYKTLQQLRHTFGSAIWENFAVVVSIKKGWFRTPDHTFGFNPPGSEVWKSHLDYWHQTFYDVEFNDTLEQTGVNWSDPKNALSKADLEAEVLSVKDTKMYGVQLIVNDWHPMFAADNIPEKIYAPTNQAQQVSDRAKVEEVQKVQDLVKLKDEIVGLRATREGGGQWNVKDMKPRFGPSSLESGQNFECKWPHACNMTVQGNYLSEADRMRIYPKDHTCGSSFAGFGDIKLPVSFTESRPKLGGTTKEKFFNFGATHEFDGLVAQEFKLCYCEYGNCDSDVRYHQEVGILTVEDTKCFVPCRDDLDSLHATLHVGECGDGKYVKPGKSNLQWKCDEGYGLNHDATQNTFPQTCNDKGELSVINACPIVHCNETPSVPGNAHRITSVVEGQIYSYKQPVTFMCNTYEGDYEARKVLDPALQEEPTRLDTKYTIDANPSGTQRVDIQCGADGNWNFLQDGGETFTKFVQDGGCRRWLVGDFGECDASCGDGSHNRPLSCEPSTAECNDATTPITTQSCMSYKGCPDCGTTAPDMSASHAHRAYDADLPAPTLLTNGDPVVYTCDFHNGYNMHGSNSTSFLKTSFQIACRKEKEWSTPKLVWSTFEGAELTEAEALTVCKKWDVSAWTTCSTNCGTGYQTRVIHCTSGKDTDCDENAKPVGLTLQKSCYVGDGCEEEARRLRELEQNKGFKMAIGWMIALPLMALLA